ncbi:MAG: PTS sugar transporter subunit IIA [Planctomycetota bacterium]
MNLLDILSADCIRAPLEATDKRGAIDELVELLAQAGRVNDADQLKEAVWTREQTRTTGIGHGLAIPHGKCAGMDRLAMAIGKPAKPLDFEAIDAQPVKLVVLLASPPDRTSDHIQALARISRLMTMDEFRKSIYAAETPDEIYELLAAEERSA